MVVSQFPPSVIHSPVRNTVAGADGPPPVERMHGVFKHQVQGVPVGHSDTCALSCRPRTVEVIGEVSGKRIDKDVEQRRPMPLEKYTAGARLVKALRERRAVPRGSCAPTSSPRLRVAP